MRPNQRGSRDSFFSYYSHSCSFHHRRRRAKPASPSGNCARTRRKMSLNLPRRSCARGRRRWTRRNRPREPIPRALRNRRVRGLSSFRVLCTTRIIKSRVVFNPAPAPRKASTASLPASTAGASNGGARTAKSDGVSISITGDKTRDKCIEMLYDALALESGFRMSLSPPL